MEVTHTLKDFSGINGKELSNVSILGYNESAPGTFESTKPIQEFTSECFCIYTQSFKIENGDWVIVDGNRTLEEGIKTHKCLYTHKREPSKRALML